MHRLLIVAIATLLPQFGNAQDPIPLRDLPTPSSEIQELLKRGKVKFVTGRRLAQSPSGSKLSAETHYRMRYTYHSKQSWRLHNVGGRRTLRVNVTYSRVGVFSEHTVWLQNPPETSSFWDSKLVLHELDHVRITSDERLKASYQRLLRAEASFDYPLGGNERASDALADRLVQQRTEHWFDQIRELADVRYRELDRITNHGRKPLPNDTPLREILRR